MQFSYLRMQHLTICLLHIEDFFLLYDFLLQHHFVKYNWILYNVIKLWNHSIDIQSS